MVFLLFTRIRGLALIAIAALATFTLTGALAAGPAIDAKLSVVRVEFNGRTEVGSPADRAKPGDVLEYATRFVNRGDAPAVAFAPTIPIPAGTDYVPAGGAPAPSHASLDGVRFAPVPLRRTVKGADGKPVEVDVPASEYRVLRWTVGDLAAGAEVTLRTRVRVQAAPTVAGGAS